MVIHKSVQPLPTSISLQTRVLQIVCMVDFDEFCRYYLKHEHECFIRYKIRGAAERFIADKARIASVLNSLKNDPFYTHLVTSFTKEFSI